MPPTRERLNKSGTQPKVCNPRTAHDLVMATGAARRNPTHYNMAIACRGNKSAQILAIKKPAKKRASQK